MLKQREVFFWTAVSFEFEYFHINESESVLTDIVIPRTDGGRLSPLRFFADSEKNGGA